MAKGNPSQLPGTHRTRVFVGGSYAPDNRLLLDGLTLSVRQTGFAPIVASDFELLRPERDVHDVTLWLLHACRLAIFEVSTLSGALMELERVLEYGIRKALLLYQHPARKPWPDSDDAWRSSQMLKSLAREHEDIMMVRVYARPRDAFREVRSFLTAIRRSAYGKIHGF